MLGSGHKRPAPPDNTLDHLTKPIARGLRRAEPQAPGFFMAGFPCQYGYVNCCKASVALLPNNGITPMENENRMQFHMELHARPINI